MNSPNPSHGSFARVLVLTSVFIGCWLARAGDTSEASLRSGNSLPQSVVRADSSVSPRDRLLQLASQAPFQSPRLILLGEVAISEEETRELLGIYEQATAQYEGASTPLDRRLALVGWAERVTDFLAKYPQSAYFPGASLQLAAHHDRILNQTGVRQHAETAWTATRDRTENPGREVARESSFLLARSLLLSAEHVAFDELYKSALAHSPRETLYSNVACRIGHQALGVNAGVAIPGNGTATPWAEPMLGVSNFGAAFFYGGGFTWATDPEDAHNLSTQ